MLIRRYTLTPLLCGLSYLPLPWLRGIGTVMGRLLYKFSSQKGRVRLSDNLLLTGMCSNDELTTMSRRTAEELCKTLIETITIAWFRSKQYNAGLVNEMHGIELVETEISRGKAIVFLTPHIGNFEIALKATAYRLKNNFTVLYKPAKDEWYNELMLNGRSEDNIKPVPITARGILSLVKALRNHEYIGVLPDSVASQGDGVWVDFFGQRVFAATLAAKMSSVKDVATFVVGSRRVANGFVVEYIPYITTSDKPLTMTQEIYKIIESIVLKAREQYFWSYDRFRKPSHAPAE